MFRFPSAVTLLPLSLSFSLSFFLTGSPYKYGTCICKCGLSTPDYSDAAAVSAPGNVIVLYSFPSPTLLLLPFPSPASFGCNLIFILKKPIYICAFVAPLRVLQRFFVSRREQLNGHVTEVERKRECKRGGEASVRM